MGVAQKFKSRPVPITAAQYTGGEKNATDIVEWVVSEGGSAKWNRSIDPDTETGGVAEPIESLWMKTKDYGEHVKVGLWIAKVGDHFVILAEDELKKKFKPVV